MKSRGGASSTENLFSPMEKQTHAEFKKLLKVY